MKKQIGYKAGSGSSKKPYTAPDSASSKSIANIVYGISEGEIAGFVNGDQSIILDNTPVQSISGDYNITGVEVDHRLGTNDQTFMPGFPSVVNEIGYSNVELKSTSPFVHYVNDLNVNAARVRFTWGKIFRQNPDSGDVYGYRIEYAIDVQTDGNGFVEVLKTALDDKTSNGYQRQHRIELPPAQIGWEIRVRRLTPNQASDFVGDKMYLTAVAEIIDTKLRYPNTAIVGLKFDADKFGSIPKADFRLRGKLIKVPTNYDTEKRTYSTTGVGTTNGVWDGTFKIAYSNNPAWIFYDLVLSRRYGLGDRIDASMLDKWSLYSIAQHCDVMVPDGLGGLEPRLTCNVYLNNKFEAFELLMQLVSTFQGIIHWEGSSIVCTADRPTDPVYTFTRSNIIGEFNYSGTRARDRHSLFSVAFDDPANNYKTDKEVVSSSKAISEVGVRVKELTAFGCTSRGQAQRIGRRALLKEQEETRMVTFAVGLEGYIPITGKIIEIADPLLAGRAIGGRISVVSSDSLHITVDRDIESSLEGNKRLVINGDDGIQQSRDIVGINGRVITVSAAFVGVSAEHVWAIDSDDLKLMRFRVLSVSQNRSDSGIISFTVSAVQHNPNTQDASDNSTYLEPSNYSKIDIYTQETVKNFLIDSENTINQGIDITNVVFSWDQAKGAVKYELEWRRDNGTWIKAPLIYSNTYTVENVYHGVYEARIVAINAMDVRSLYVVADPKVINSKFAEPPMLSAISATGTLFGAEFNWAFPDKFAQNAEYTEVQISYLPDHTDAKLLGNYSYPSRNANITGLHGNLQLWVRARIIDRNKVEGPWTIWVTTTTDAEASILLDALNGKITSSQLDQDLNQSIILGSGAAQTAEDAQNSANAAAQAATNAQAAADQAQAQVTAATTELRGLLDVTADGLTQEILDRQNGDANVIGQLDTYKTSNDAAMAAVQQQVEAASSASSANATALTNLNTEVVAAHNLASNALQQAQSATDATSTNASNLIALSSRMATAEQDINSLETAKLDASVIQQYRTAVDQDTATASSLTMLRSQLASGARNFVRNTGTPQQGFFWMFQQPLTEKLTGEITISFDVEALDDPPVGYMGGGVGFNMGDAGIGGFNYVWYPNLATKGHLTYTLTTDSGTFTHFGIYANNVVKVTNVMVQRGGVDYPWAAAPEDNEAAIDANAQAIRNTETAIATVDGKVNAHATDILNLGTGLTNLNNSKLDATIIQQYRTAVDQDSVTTSALTQFKSELKIGGVNVLLNSKEPRSGVNEYLMYENSVELKNFYDQHLNKDVTVSCEIYVPVAGNVQIYTSNQSAHYFSFGTPIPANQWTRVVATVKPIPHDTNPDWHTSSLEFYADYGTGRIVTVRNVQLEAGNFATDWSPSPRDYEKAANLTAEALENVYTKTEANEATTGLIQSFNAKLKIGGTNIFSSGTVLDAYNINMHERSHSVQGNTLAFGTANTASRTLRFNNVVDSLGWYTVSGFVRGNQGIAVPFAVDFCDQGRAELVSRDDDTDMYFEVSVNIQDTPHRFMDIEPLGWVNYVFTNIKIEKGNKATAWSPALYDTADATALTQTRAEVQQLNGQVSSLASQTSTLSTTVGNNTAAIQLQQSSIDGINAKATLQVEAGGTIGGVALGNNQGVVDVLIRSNNFAIAPPVGAAGANKYAFQYRSTSVTLPNGVVVPAGLYLDNATIDYIDASKIYATSLSAISAVLGTLTTYKNPANPNGARMILEGSLIRIYDDNNVMRVRMGLWS